jgi:hypothetical protein
VTANEKLAKVRTSVRDSIALLKLANDNLSTPALSYEAIHRRLRTARMLTSGALEDFEEWHKQVMIKSRG